MVWPKDANVSMMWRYVMCHYLIGYNVELRQHLGVSVKPLDGMDQFG
jgi:hypothetical protein